MTTSHPGDQKEHHWYMCALRKRVQLYGKDLPMKPGTDSVVGILEWVARYSYGVRVQGLAGVGVVLIPKHAVSFMQVLSE